MHAKNSSVKIEWKLNVQDWHISYAFLWFLHIQEYESNEKKKKQNNMDE